MVVRTVTQCNKLFSAKTPHPLVTVIRLSDTVDIPDLFQFGFHSIWIRKWTGQTPSCFGAKESAGIYLKAKLGSLMVFCYVFIHPFSILSKQGKR